MSEQTKVPVIMFSSIPLRKAVHFNETVSMPLQLTTSASVLTSVSSTSLTLPLIAERPGVRFKLLILLLGLLIALIVGFVLSLLLVTQLLPVSTRTLPSRRFPTTESDGHVENDNYRLVQYLDPTSIVGLDLTVDVCRDFYSFVCRNWLIQHPLSPLELKRSWLTERSADIRQRFAETLTNLSEVYVSNHQIVVQKSHSESVTQETEIIDFDGLTSAKNELEHFYSFHDGYDDEQHRIVKRHSMPIQNDMNQSVSNMLRYYHQCTHTSESVLLQELRQLAHDRFWFTNNYEITSTSNHLYFLFEQMTEHPLLRIWNINTINLGSQMIIHVQRQTQDQQTLFSGHQIEQARLFEHYVRKNQIDLCHQSSRVGPLGNTLKEYKQLLTFSFTNVNSTISDDLHRLITNKDSLPIIHSSVRHPHDLRDLIQFMLDKPIIHQLNKTHIYDLLVNFTYDLEQHLMHVPIFRSTIANQCQLFLHYYLRFRSLNDTGFEAWFDYISASILRLILHSWPGDASYICLYSTIVRHTQLETIAYWNTFLQYSKKQIQGVVPPVITVEIRLVDFFQLDSMFRFLFADHFAHYCNVMVYKYGPKLLPFVSVFDEGLQISLKTLWRQILQDNALEHRSIQSSPLPLHHTSNDCLSLLEYYYPFTLSSFYVQYMSNKTAQLYSVAYELRDLLRLTHTNNQFLSSLQFRIEPERLKLFHELSAAAASLPYEYYFVEDAYLSTAWNLIEGWREELFQPTHEFFEINGHHTVEQGIFLQPTVAELYSNEFTRMAALLLIAHELGHAVCPCGQNLTDREHVADIIALDLMIAYQQQQSTATNITSDWMRNFFITYGQSECAHMNRDMMIGMTRQQNFIDLHINRVLRGSEAFQTVFNCSLSQRQHAKRISSFLPELCVACREQKD